ncbi:serine O-acetyltransferase EpsC [Oceanihabitans sp. 2_MG-2023]|uniref:serine O-acetyltransferase EpsC n=1 Tax=Oceanihabitans sp. 2_MG-2023 TaxID=3062661 RepID=UPI0026E36897|nr:serine O-acetyltransferase EpsC [Oceanihabitans sp. 2_MG-2023]MDO6596214.1 serine O-acetyltransferase EpsC [Oceanihabitans sp. 2_MG-2023]
MIFNLRLKEEVAVFTKDLFYALFEKKEKQKEELGYLKAVFLKFSKELSIVDGEAIWKTFSDKLHLIKKKIELDAHAAKDNDPACKSLEEVYLAYPGFHAIAVYRLSHEFYKLDLYILSRMMSEYIHGITGIDIHAGATIGDSFFIDHGTGVVIGETAIIKRKVKIYQGVTLGGIQVKKSLASTKRHPTIEENVTIYANATILGGDIVIGANSIIGANVWITETVPANSLVTYQSEIKIKTRK